MSFQLNGCRGFEILNNYKDKNINLPVRRTAQSAGYDFESAEDVLLVRQKVVLVPTGLKAFMLPDDVLLIYIRSSLAFKHQIMLANGVGVIDADYGGHILFPIINFGDSDFFIKKGMRLAQGVFQKYLTIDNDKAGIGELRSGGFGSTGG
ncbi:MAG: dUTP diphosphatase [Selenomonadaceae bacterium]|nr:dUTP diphosphatase [Selenomonadaceae bacterium]MBR1858077.1 dUTP diphosphatase [Selenomonadaceae bacterium]